MRPALRPPRCAAVCTHAGNKVAHFKALRDATGISYSEMLFFDDSADGKYGNCEPVS